MPRRPARRLAVAKRRRLLHLPLLLPKLAPTQTIWESSGRPASLSLSEQMYAFVKFSTVLSLIILFHSENRVRSFILSYKVQKKIVEDAERRVSAFLESVREGKVQPSIASLTAQLFEAIAAGKADAAQDQLTKLVQKHGAEVSAWSMGLKKFIHALKTTA
eukprot:m.59930 g.59930  ORF g.59930 m.59930 type:complete len:161 (+) comp12262_c0_seq3:161-643(+)